VLPFSADVADSSGAMLAQRLTDGVTAELVRAGRFSVVASSAARAKYTTARRPRDVAAALDADVLIQARIRADGDRLRIETYAVSGRLEEKLWVESFAGTVADTETLERDIAAAIVDSVGARELP
jgi:TolB-like protein